MYSDVRVSACATFAHNSASRYSSRSNHSKAATSAAQGTTRASRVGRMNDTRLDPRVDQRSQSTSKRVQVSSILKLVFVCVGLTIDIDALTPIFAKSTRKKFINRSIQTNDTHLRTLDMNRAHRTQNRMRHILPTKNQSAYRNTGAHKVLIISFDSTGADPTKTR